MQIIKRTVAAAAGPLAVSAGYELAFPGRWLRRGSQLVTEIALELSKGTAERRSFSIDWSIYVPGLGSLLYEQEQDPFVTSAWPAVKGGSDQVDAALKSNGSTRPRQYPTRGRQV